MTARFTKLRRFTLSSDSGLTIVELLVASFISLLIVGMSIGLTLSTRQLYFYDSTRIELSQNLRGAIDLVGIDIREGGERLNGSFPAVVINDNVGGTGVDELILRRNLLDEVLVVCRNVAAGSSATEIYLNLTGSTNAACTFGAQASNIAKWTTYRGTHGEGGVLKAYIFDQTTKLGEFFDYNNEVNNGTDVYLQNAGHTFTNSYTGGAAAVYIIEEQKYGVSDDLLKLVVDDDTANPFNVVFGLTDFEVIARMQDGTTKNAFAITDDWSTIESVQVTLEGTLPITGKAGTLGQELEKSVSARFFPRNILSN